MNKAWFVFVILASASSVCFRTQPKLIKATIEPTTASVGDSVLVLVEFSGKQSDIKEVYLVVREYPYDYPKINLHPDKSSKKNVWSDHDKIPFDAYSQTYHLDITAIDEKGKPIVTKGCEDSRCGKVGSIEFEVR